MDSNPVTSIHSVAKVVIEPKQIPPNPGRSRHGLCYFLEGESGFVFGGKEFIAKAGSLVYLPKGAPYGFIRNHSAVCIRIDFNTTHSTLYEPFCHIYSNTSQFKELFLSIYHLQSNKRAGYEAHQLSILYKIISMIQENESSAYVSSRHFMKIAPSLEFLKVNFLDSSVTVSTLAQMCGMSTRYYTMLFNSVFMCSPKQYIINMKIDMAKDMLAATDENLNIIAEKCGFSDVFYFCKMFKKATNISPTKYRKKNAYL